MLNRAFSLLFLAVATCWSATSLVRGDETAPPWPVSDYDDGDWHVIRGGKRLSFYGMRQSWVYNRAMIWAEKDFAGERVILCYSGQSPLPLTGTKQVSRWYSDPRNTVVDLDSETTRFVKRNSDTTWDHVCLPPFQFSLEQHPVVRLSVRAATHPWQFLVMVRGRTGPPLFTSPWLSGPQNLELDIRQMYRKKGYPHQFAEVVFFMVVRTEHPQDEASVDFALSLHGGEALLPSLPVIRTIKRASKQGIPVACLVLDSTAKRLGSDAVVVTARWNDQAINLEADENNIWHGRLLDLPIGDHTIALEATFKNDPAKRLRNTQRASITDGQFVIYDPSLKLLTRGGTPLGPLTGSYRGQIIFQNLGKPDETPLQGEEAWRRAIANPQQPNYGFQFWEALTPAELDSDFAYLANCGWHIIHLCSAWAWWPRWDAAGHLSPYYAEHLYETSCVARRHGLMLHLALSHYPYGTRTPPYAQYLEAGYRLEDYQKPDSRFYQMFSHYLQQFATVFRDDSTICSFTASGEGDFACGPLFVNTVHDIFREAGMPHVFAAEPHWKIVQDPNFYLREGWKPLLAGMRTYFIDSLPPEAIGVQFKLASMGHLFMAEGCFYGYLGGNIHFMNPEMPIDRYRRRIRETIYTGFAHRNPILLTWEERIVEDERKVLDRVRRMIDWSIRFQRPPVAIRVYPEHMPPEGRNVLFEAEKALSQIPLEVFYLWENEPVPPGTAVVLDARQSMPVLKLASQGGGLPDSLAEFMPLRLPPGWAANYSWSEDRSVLLAFLRRQTDGDDWTTEEGGPYSYIDTQLVLKDQQAISGWKVLCRSPGRIQLIIYRQVNDEFVKVAEGPVEMMTAPGWCQFRLDRPVEVKPGDMVGFYIPDEATRIAAKPMGRMLFTDGAAEKRSPVHIWQEEPKSAAIAVLTEEYKSWERDESSSGGMPLLLRHFPARNLEFVLFDLESKTVSRHGVFQESGSFTLPQEGDHFFLVVRPDLKENDSDE